MLEQLPYYAIGFKRAHAIEVLVHVQAATYSELCKLSNAEIEDRLFAAKVAFPSQCAGVFTEIPTNILDAQVLAKTTNGHYSLNRYYQITLGLSEFELKNSYHFYDFDRNK